MKNYIESIQYTGSLDKPSYLSDLYVVKYLVQKKAIHFKTNITFFTGENGTGKSTLIEAIALAFGFNAEGGSKNSNFSTRNTTSRLFKHIRLIKSSFPKDGFFFRSESFYNVISNIDDIGVSGYGKRSLHEKSHGESFFSLFKNRFRGNGLYILDEPESALSPSKQMTMLTLINELLKNNSQILIATHSPILLSFPGAEIFELTNSSLKKIKFEESQIYVLYKRFLNNPKQMLKYLFD